MTQQLMQWMLFHVHQTPCMGPECCSECRKWGCLTGRKVGRTEIDAPARMMDANRPVMASRWIRVGGLLSAMVLQADVDS